MPRVVRALAAALALALAAAPSRAGELTPLVDASFAPAPQSPPAELVVNAPVLDPKSLPGDVVPESEEALMWVILAATGGFLAGAAVGGFICCFLFFTLYY
ncbi:hypothetical protein L6R49_27655 [Myxococcota bacterium]|nr:hypothetical protein [Myxococcota bacterium]